MRVLITGGAGFLGSHLAEGFLKRGDEVFVLDMAPSLKVEHLLSSPNFHYVRDSVFNEGMLENLIVRSDLVYHLAAVVGVEHYVGDPYQVLNVNINGTQNVLKLAHRYNKKVVMASTSEVYGRNTKVPFKEDDDRVLGSTRIDRWCYSTSKAAAEHFCFAYRKLGLPVVIVRYFNIYGPRLDKIDVGRVLTIFMGQLLRHEPLTVIGDGKQTRCFTYVEDAIRATMAAGLVPEAVGDIFNIGTDRETPILELAQTMIKITGARSTIKLVPQETIYGSSYEDIPRRVPDNTKMKTILKVKTEVSLEDGLRRTIEWFQKAHFEASQVAGSK
ncbi:MAG: NAD-dependent epimerase/dehydratase family protein [Elusimicrobiota bacterium]|jgi:UDP-glucose 4-epimerase